jgi:hypothetical protein
MSLSVHTIYLYDRYSEHELYRESVIPHLLTNRFRPRVRAIQKTRPTPYRAKVLGRALISARTDANSFWMLLSGNAEVAFHQEPRRSQRLRTSQHLLLTLLQVLLLRCLPLLLLLLLRMPLLPLLLLLLRMLLHLLLVRNAKASLNPFKKSSI